MDEQNNRQANKPVQSPKNIWIVGVAIGLSLIVASSVYAWQNKNIPEINGETSVTKTVSTGGSVNDFYMRMGLSCPKESAECNYITMMVPENYEAYIKKMTQFVQEGGVNPLETQIFVQKELYVPFMDDLVRASAQAAAGEIPTSGGPAKASIAYLSVQDSMAYVLLDIDLDGWAGSSVSVAIIHPLVEKTLLLFPEISHVVFGYAPGVR